MRARFRSRDKGYLLVLVAVCVSILTISFLRLAASSAGADDQSDVEVAMSRAFYAAESGLLVAETNLRKWKGGPPTTGAWLTGELPNSLSRYSVEVLRDSDSPRGFLVRSTGKTPGEGGKLYSITLEAVVLPGPKSTWLIGSRKQL